MGRGHRGRHRRRPRLPRGRRLGRRRPACRRGGGSRGRGRPDHEPEAHRRERNGPARHRQRPWPGRQRRRAGRRHHGRNASWCAPRAPGSRIPPGPRHADDSSRGRGSPPPPPSRSRSRWVPDGPSRAGSPDRCASWPTWPGGSRAATTASAPGRRAPGRSPTWLTASTTRPTRSRPARPPAGRWRPTWPTSCAPRSAPCRRVWRSCATASSPPTPRRSPGCTTRACASVAWSPTSVCSPRPTTLGPGRSTGRTDLAAAGPRGAGRRAARSCGPPASPSAASSSRP